MPEALTTIEGRALGLADTGNLVGNNLQITAPLVDATIVVSTETSNVRTVTIRLKDIHGSALAYVADIWIAVFTDTTRTAYATGGSTGLAIGTDGALLPVVAKKLFLATSESNGNIDLTWTDTGTESVSVGIRLPTGRWVMSDAFANT